MELSKNPDWRLTKSFLVILGLWPFHQTYLQTILSSVAIIAIISIVIPEAIKMISVWGDVNAIAESAPLLTGHLGTLIRMSSFLFYFNKFKTILEDIQKDLSSDLSDLEIKIIQHYGHFNRRLTHAYAWVFLVCTIAMMCSPLAQKVLDVIAPLNDSRKIEFFYSVEYLIDPVTYRVPIFIHLYLITPFPTLVAVAFDATYCHCVQHGCCMFAIIRHRLQLIPDQTYPKMCEDVAYEKKIRRLLTDCVKQHVNTLQYCDNLESLYSVILLPIVTIITLSLSITGFHTLMKLDDPPEAFTYGCLIFGCIAILFSFTYIGQTLTDHSESIHKFTYDRQWYNMSPKLRSFFILMMIRSSKTCRLTAGKFYILSIENFGKVIKLAVSYFTVLLSLQ